jgi:putative glutamine amidotransferase
MKPRIAIPLPHSQMPEYNARTLPEYKHAVAASGGEPIEIPLDRSPEELAKLIAKCDAVLLPGSPADVDPQKFSQPRHPETAPADPARDNVDELLLQDAYNMRKPVFGICYGLQSLNVWRTGTLVQHIESDQPHEVKGGKPAHPIDVAPDSRLGRILGADEIKVNTSHHQSAGVVGDGLRVVARSPQDRVIEAIEGTDPEQFVLAVQWHPERHFNDDPHSQKLFAAFIEEAKRYVAKAQPMVTRK